MNKNKLKWVPKKVRKLFEKDSNYDINLYIRSKNIDLKNLPSGIDYEYEYLKTQYKWIYVLFFWNSTIRNFGDSFFDFEFCMGKFLGTNKRANFCLCYNCHYFLNKLLDIIYNMDLFIHEKYK